MKYWLATALCFAVPSSASADWQGTKWGMTAEQVIAATKKAVEINSDRGLDSRAEIAAYKMPYVAAGITFTAYLRFDAKTFGLTSVSLIPNNNADCFKLFDTLQQKYGEPVSKVRSSVVHSLKWEDLANENTIGAVALPSRSAAQTCSADYRPFGPKVGPGL